MAKDADPIPTGVAWLDRRLRRGGIPPGRVLGIGGPPFAGKTTLVGQIAYECSKRLPVFCLFADEGDDQAATRIAVMAGIPLELVDSDPLKAGATLTARLIDQGCSLEFLEPDRSGACAEAVVDHAAEIVPKGMPALIVLDSVQTIRARREGSETDKRLRILELADDCRAWAEELRFIFLLTSKSNRGFYRSRREEDNSTPMAAFAEAAIEYALDLAIVLGLTDDESGIVKAQIPKNRLRSREKLSNVLDLRYSDDSGTMLELDAVELQAAASAAHDTLLQPHKEKILSAVAKYDIGLTGRLLAEACGITGQRSRALHEEAREILVHQGLLTKAPHIGRGGGFAYSLPG